MKNIIGGIVVFGAFAAGVVYVNVFLGVIVAVLAAFFGGMR